VVLFGLACLRLLDSSALAGEASPADSAARKPTVVRFPQNPIIRPDMLPGDEGANINGPSLIRVPDWIAKPLGKYYLYFAHHRGKYIRVAFADRLEGPWTIYKPGVLSLKEAAAVNPACSGHIASPDVHVDASQKEIRMYFHCAVKGEGQSTFVALSNDGLHFAPRPTILGDFYFRVLPWGGWYYAVDRRGMISRSKDGLTRFEKVSDTLARAAEDKTIGATFRHSALQLDGDVLTIFLCRVGDSPESILLSKIKLTPDPATWKASPPVRILEPETDYEGAGMPIVKSKDGPTPPVRALRDPCIFREGGKTYLLYSVKGEYGIAIGELKASAER